MSFSIVFQLFVLQARDIFYVLWRQLNWCYVPCCFLGSEAQAVPVRPFLGIEQLGKCSRQKRRPPRLERLLWILVKGCKELGGKT